MGIPTQIMERLRAETRDLHVETEQQPFFKALETGSLPLEGYIGLLRALSIIHSALDNQLASAQHPAVSGVAGHYRSRLPALRQDIAFLEQQNNQETAAASLYAMLLAEEIRRLGAEDAVALLGYLYVLEGSMLGGLIIRLQVQRAFDLQAGEGIAYLAGVDKQTRARWDDFSRRINAVVVDAAEQERVIEAARQAFAGMQRIVGALYPLSPHTPDTLVQTLNPAAGNHAIPDDLREIAAALRAGEQSWRDLPYYAMRYGERGRMFTRSDSSWIVTLVRYPQHVVTQQISWLGRVLASRGMPQWMLERHLGVLHRELSAAVPERQEQYDRLLGAAGRLREMRRAQISDERFEALAQRFDLLVGPEWSARLPKTGFILTAAVADERAGIARAVSSLEGWMVDPERFPPVWIEAVHQTLHAARQSQ